MNRSGHLYKSVWLLSVFLALAAAGPAGAAGGDPCADSIAVSPDSIVRGFAGNRVRFALEIETPGIVTAELAAGGEAETSTRLGLLAPGCVEFDRVRWGRDHVLIEESASRLVFAALHPGTYFVAAETADSLRAAERLKLVTSLEQIEVQPRLWKIGPRTAVTLVLPGGDAGPLAKDEDHEVDPDPWSKSAFREWTAIVLFAAPMAVKDEDHEVDPDPWSTGDDVTVSWRQARRIRVADAGGSSIDELHSWLAGRIGSPSKVGDSRFRLLADYPLSEAPMLLSPVAAGCRSGERDDHGDTFACATALRLGSPVSAELANGWGDDEDVFRFRLGELGTVALEASGPAAPALALYDRFGQRLATVALVDGRARLLRTLRAGDYFVRVSGMPGAYELTVE